MADERDDYNAMVEEAILLRELLFEDASWMTRGAMVGSPVECIAFARAWIQRSKGLTPWCEMPNYFAGPGDDLAEINAESERQPSEVQF